MAVFKYNPYTTYIEFGIGGGRKDIYSEINSNITLKMAAPLDKGVQGTRYDHKNALYTTFKKGEISEIFLKLKYVWNLIAPAMYKYDNSPIDKNDLNDLKTFFSLKHKTYCRFYHSVNIFVMNMSPKFDNNGQLESLSVWFNIENKENGSNKLAHSFKIFSREQVTDYDMATRSNKPVLDQNNNPIIQSVMDFDIYSLLKFLDGNLFTASNMTGHKVVFDKDTYIRDKERKEWIANNRNGGNNNNQNNYKNNNASNNNNYNQQNNFNPNQFINNQPQQQNQQQATQTQQPTQQQNQQQPTQTQQPQVPNGYNSAETQNAPFFSYQ